MCRCPNNPNSPYTVFYCICALFDYILFNGFSASYIPFLVFFHKYSLLYYYIECVYVYNVYIIFFLQWIIHHNTGQTRTVSPLRIVLNGGDVFLMLRRTKVLVKIWNVSLYPNIISQCIGLYRLTSCLYISFVFCQVVGDQWLKVAHNLIWNLW